MTHPFLAYERRVFWAKRRKERMEQLRQLKALKKAEQKKQGVNQNDL